MPEAAQDHGGEQVDIRPHLAAAVAPQRDVEIVPQPGGEREVPPPPEFGDRLALVGGVEVLGKDPAEHQPQADRHVGIGAEVEVDLEGVGADAIPGVERRGGARVEDGVGHLAAGIGQENLLGQSQREEGDAAGEFLERVRPLEELVGHILEADDRPSHQLRKHRHVAHVVEDRADRPGVAAVDVDGVAHRLKRVEADPEG